MHSPNMSLKEHHGSLRLINFDTHKKDGFRLYTCSPVYYHENKSIIQIGEPEIRFRANKTVDGHSIGQAIKRKNSSFCFQLIMNIVTNIIFTEIPLTQHKHKTFINELWNGLNQEHKKEIVKIIYKTKPQLLLSKESVYNTLITGNNAREFFSIVCKNHSIPAPFTVAPAKASHIIFINDKVYAKRAGSESVALYTQRHPEECCIVHNKTALENILKLHKDKQQTISLVIFADNNNNKKNGCLDWTLETVGCKLGEIINNHPCIGHLNLFTCYSGSLDSTKFHNAKFYEKSKGAQDLSRALSVYPVPTLSESPFEVNTIAQQICDIVLPSIKARGPLAISASPRYIHNDQSHFFGSSEGIPYYPHSFSKHESPLLHYKKITFFMGDEKLFKGVCSTKSNKTLANYTQVVLNEEDKTMIKFDTSPSLTPRFFKQVAKQSEPTNIIQNSHDIYSDSNGINYAS